MGKAENREVLERNKLRKAVFIDVFGPRMEDLNHEEFWAVFLNGANK